MHSCFDLRCAAFLRKIRMRRSRMNCVRSSPRLVATSPRGLYTKAGSSTTASTVGIAESQNSPR